MMPTTILRRPSCRAREGREQNLKGVCASKQVACQRVWRNIPIMLINRPIFSRAEKIPSCINELSAREQIGPVNELLTSQSTFLFKRFAAYFR
jgi:hypothetical protein